MEYSKISPIEKKFSRFIVGTGNVVDDDTINESFDRLDAALDRGINVIDTAMGYGRGTSETALGKYFESRKNRDDLVVISKCCHPAPPFTCHRVNEGAIREDFENALRKMKTDYIDIYLLHRDDPTTPVSEIIDTLYEYYKKGQMLAYGVSNWTIPRIEEANAYAASKGIPGFIVSSPNYSLMQQYAEPWPMNCVTIAGPENKENRKWYVEHKMPVLAYSSMAMGMASGRVTREDHSILSPNGAKAYLGEENFKRLDRAQELAKEKGCSVAQISMAFVLDGEMDVYPIIGAANGAEMDSSIAALDLKLTPQEIAYLDLESDER
jgi:aryl-alcohol dehydrogenase-like predicted oxidoreductase